MSEQLDQKFKALLDPIKDLAASWDIDIADSLTDYLEDLENISISVDGGKCNINFATAALLIQGSTQVYSKKVEFLHQLVLQSLELISNKKNKETAASGKNKSSSNSSFDEERLLFGSDPSFLLLDDVVEEGSNINLVDTQSGNVDGKGKRRSSVRVTTTPNVYSMHAIIHLIISYFLTIGFAQARHSVSGDFSRASMVLMHSVLQEDHGGSSLRMVRQA
jgi:Condensin II complex subunit CAP-H2 or CNDH2, N-terminal